MKKTLLSLTVLICSMISIAPVAVVYGADPITNPVKLFNQPCDNNSAAKNSSVCDDAKASGNPLFGPSGIITKLANLLTILIGIAAVIGIILAAIKMATNGNNPQEVSQARDLIIYAVAGLVLAAMAQALVRLVLFRINFS